MNLYKLHTKPEELNYFNDRIEMKNTDRIKEWFVNGGRYWAEISDTGNKFWYMDGLLHREDGPAIIYTDGEERWWLHNTEYSEKGWKEEMGL